MTNNPQRQGLIFILLSTAGYALLPVLVKTLQSAGFISLDLVTLRFALATPIFWLVVGGGRFRSDSTPISMGRLPILRLMFMGSFLALAALVAFWGLERLPAGTLVVLFYTYPAMVAILSTLLGERLNRYAWIALALTIPGVWLSVPDFGVGLGERTAEGVMLALVDGLIVAVYFILNSRLMKGHPAVAEGSALAVSGGLIVLVMVALIQGRAVRLPVEVNDWLILLALASVSTVLPVFFLTAGIQKVGPTRASIFGTFEPILTFIFAALFLQESMQAIQLLGGGLILLSVILLQVRGHVTEIEPQLVPSDL